MSIEGAKPGMRDVHRSLDLAETAFYLVLAACAVFLAAWLLSWTEYGLDVTDESFYLNWIRNPHLYEFSVTQFGFFYHYLFFPFHDDVVSLRAANIVTLMGAGWFFGFILLRSFFFQTGRMKPDALAASAALPLGLAALLPIRNWLASPNYNTLTLTGLLVAAAALVMISRASARRSAGPFILLAIGGWMCFLAKPTSAALLAPAALAYLLLQGKAELRGIAIAAVTAAGLLLLTGLVIDGSVLVFFHRMVDAVAFATHLDPSYQTNGLLRFGLPALGSRNWVLLLLLAVAIAAMALACSAASLRWRIAGFAGAIVTMLLGPVMALSDGTLVLATWSPVLALQMLAVPLGAALALACAVAINGRVHISRELVLLALLLAVLPYIYAVGTNTNYWRQSAGAGIFWAASAIILWRAMGAGLSRSSALLPIVASTYAIAATVLIAGLETPYRQMQPLRLNDTSAVVGPAKSELFLSRDFAAYLERLDQLASEGGFQPATPVVDLTGHFPGAMYMLDADAIGLPWLIGGYPGSEDLARLALARVPCADIARAWLLTEPEGPRALPVSLLAEFGMDYAVQAELQAPSPYGQDSHQQVLLRPSHDDTEVVDACERQKALVNAAE